MGPDLPQERRQGDLAHQGRLSSHVWASHKRKDLLPLSASPHTAEANVVGNETRVKAEALGPEARGLVLGEEFRLAHVVLPAVGAGPRMEREGAEHVQLGRRVHRPEPNLGALGELAHQVLQDLGQPGLPVLLGPLMPRQQRLELGVGEPPEALLLRSELPFPRRGHRVRHLDLVLPELGALHLGRQALHVGLHALLRLLHPVLELVEQGVDPSRLGNHTAIPLGLVPVKSLLQLAHQRPQLTLRHQQQQPLEQRRLGLGQVLPHALHQLNHALEAPQREKEISQPLLRHVLVKHDVRLVPPHASRAGGQPHQAALQVHADAFQARVVVLGQARDAHELLDGLLARHDAADGLERVQEPLPQQAVARPRGAVVELVQQSPFLPALAVLHDLQVGQGRGVQARRRGQSRRIFALLLAGVAVGAFTVAADQGRNAVLGDHAQRAARQDRLVEHAHAQEVDEAAKREQAGLLIPLLHPVNRAGHLRRHHFVLRLGRHRLFGKGPLGEFGRVLQELPQHPFGLLGHEAGGRRRGHDLHGPHRLEEGVELGPHQVVLQLAHQHPPRRHVHRRHADLHHLVAAIVAGAADALADGDHHGLLGRVPHHLRIEEGPWGEHRHLLSVHHRAVLLPLLLPLPVPLRQLLGRLRLLNHDHLVAPPGELLRIVGVGSFREAAVGLLPLHVSKAQVLHANVGIHLVHFVKFPHLEKEDRVEVLGFELPPLPLPGRDLVVLEPPLGDVKG
mmetsp:Transcript_11608/g.30002  ORF Transcript_11608/g.30002 Transcript_11608/m.30002 type:complete len:736 (+) Transcript_11608:1046-3253(+)